MLAAGVATIALSLVVSIAPALAAKGGNSTIVKVHDAATGLEAGEVGNEPWVCELWVAFTGSEADSGTWRVLSWPPTGDGSEVASGTYDTAGDGSDTSGVLTLAEGHYRLESQSVSDASSKNKTFWVACDSTDSGAEPGDETPPSEDDPNGDVQDEVETPPSDEADPDEEANPDQEDPDGTDEGAEAPEEEILDGNPGPVAAPDAPEGDLAPADGGPAAVPDTALSVQPSGVLATIGVLLIIAAHVGTRRPRSLPAA